MKKHVLVANDDGINSGFLRALVEALEPYFKVSVAAPKSEQSWIGRAISRHSEIKVEKVDSLFSEGIEAWSLDGTPSDCVNIALGHLLETPPDIVVSGINIGFNTADILVLSSGTIAGAIEGSLWGHPSIAFSQTIPHEVYNEIHSKGGVPTAEFSPVLEASAEKAAQITLQTVESPPDQGVVLNVNFPNNMHREAQTETTCPAKIRLGSLYRQTKPGTYQFSYSEGTIIETDGHSDREALERGNISISPLNFSHAAQKNDKKVKKTIN